MIYPDVNSDGDGSADGLGHPTHGDVDGGEDGGGARVPHAPPARLPRVTPVSRRAPPAVPPLVPGIARVTGRAPVQLQVTRPRKPSNEIHTYMSSVEIHIASTHPRKCRQCLTT